MGLSGSAQDSAFSAPARPHEGTQSQVKGPLLPQMSVFSVANDQPVWLSLAEPGGSQERVRISDNSVDEVRHVQCTRL